MRVFPELEAYRDRLVDRCAAWPDTDGQELVRELCRCQEQAALIEKAIAGLTARLEGAGRDDSDRISHKLAVQEQLRDLTLAYAEVLRRQIEKHAS